MATLAARALIDDDDRRQDTATSFLSRRSVRDTWIAIWVMWILWSLLFLAKQFFKYRVIDTTRDRMVTTSAAVAPNADVYNGVGPTGTSGIADPASDGTLPTTAPVTGRRHQKGLFNRATNDMRERVFRTHDLVRDLTLMLLLVVALNHFGLASGVFVLILTWIYLAIAWMWVGLMLLVESRVLDVLLGSVEMLLLLAMLIGAYVLGWKTYY
ncbi:MAG: hypothetical protein J3Q66DRAFT_335696 [Benniella sp.]|nr:MAG: hypothetical protein J3Q66DRAFT_335696 [Benniella sp.]